MSCVHCGKGFMWVEKYPMVVMYTSGRTQEVHRTHCSNALCLEGERKL